LTTSLNLEVDHLDVKTTLFHGGLEEEIYMEHYEGFTVKGKKKLVCSLRNDLMDSNKLQDNGIEIFFLHV